MDKLQMAHEMALAIQGAKLLHDMELVSEMAWKYADAMQAEAEEREDKTRPDVLLTKDKDGKCLHFNHEFGHKKCMDCGDSLEEWQPDWSQAPDDKVQYFAVDESGIGGWYVTKPELCFDHWYWSDWGERMGEYDHAPSFNYQGNWKNSLRKRPQ